MHMGPSGMMMARADHDVLTRGQSLQVKTTSLKGLNSPRLRLRLHSNCELSDKGFKRPIAFQRPSFVPALSGATPLSDCSSVARHIDTTYAKHHTLEITVVIVFKIFIQISIIE